MNSRARCTNCKSYYDPESMYWTNGVQRICTSACLSEYMDRRRPKRNAVRERRKVKAAKPASLPLPLRLHIRTRDMNACRWCLRPGNQVHHVHYRSEGGPDEESNLILLCTECHARAHSSKLAFKPLLLAYIWIYYVQGRRLSIPEVAKYLDSLGFLSELQRERLAA